MNKPTDMYLAEAFNKILRPLVKVLIRSGVRYEEFCRIAKGVYIESAIRDGVGLPGEPTSTKVALATGVTRRDVELHVADSANVPRPEKTIQATLSELLHRWHTESLFLGPYGIPLEVDYEGSAGSRSFQELCRQVDSSIDSKLLLEEMLRIGVVAKSGERHLKVLSRTFLVPEPMSPVLLEYFGNTITDLTTTLEFNMDPGNQSKRLQRSVYADRGLTKAQIAEFEPFAKAKAQEFMVEIDNWLADTSSKIRMGDDPIYQVGLSVFQYVRPRAEAPLESLIDLQAE
jgi:hypothetical protein